MGVVLWSYMKKLGIAESADEDIVKQAFREKKMELQKQLGAKNPDVQKQASADLSELIHAYAVWKKTARNVK